MIKNDFDRVFKEVDCLITPTSPTVAFNLGEKTDDPMTMYLADVFVSPAAVAGVPALSMNAGFTKDKLPVGVQFIGPRLKEEMVLRIGHQLEIAS